MADLAPVARDDRQPHAVLAPMKFVETGEHAGDAPDGSLKVGWTVRRGNRVIGGFSWIINPQAIGRTHSTRTSLFATKGGFYAQQFGAGPTAITLRQLVASGAELTPGVVYSTREEMQRFLSEVWTPATQPNAPDIYFHDNHFNPGHMEQVIFPPQSLSIQRSVDQHNIWLVEITMQGLERYPYEDDIPDPSIDPSSRQTARKYVVRKGDTLESIVRHLAGSDSSKEKRRLVLAVILQLNPQLKHSREVNGHDVKAMTVEPGETILLPATGGRKSAAPDTPASRTTIVDNGAGARDLPGLPGDTSDDGEA